MSRPILTGLMVLLYVASVNVWIYLLASGQLTNRQNRLSSYVINGIMLAFCFLDLKSITRVPFHSNFNDVGFLTLITNFILNIANHSGLINADMPSMFYTFNGLIFAITLMALISAARYGYFKKTSNG